RGARGPAARTFRKDTGKTRRGPTRGAASASSPRYGSSGSTATTACTIAFGTGATAGRGAAGAPLRKLPRVGDEEREQGDLDRELIEFLNELRIALPGVQVLFAFLLAVPF